MHLDKDQAEQMLPEFLKAENDGPRSVTCTPEFEAGASSAASATAPTTENTEPVPEKVAKAQAKLKQKAEERAQQLYERNKKATAEREARQQKRDDDKEKERLQKETHKNSAQGQAEEFLAGVIRDLERVDLTAHETATCGMAAGFAREWKCTFQKHSKAFTVLKGKLEKITKGESGADEQLLLDTTKAAERFKQDLKNFRTAKNFKKNE